MTSHVYNTRNNLFQQSKKNFEASEASVISETANLILSLEKDLTSRFHGLEKEIQNLKDVIVKNLQLESHDLTKKVSDLESKTISRERNHNSLKQYERRNNIKINEILDSVPNQNLEQKVIKILD